MLDFEETVINLGSYLPALIHSIGMYSNAEVILLHLYTMYEDTVGNLHHLKLLLSLSKAKTKSSKSNTAVHGDISISLPLTMYV